MGKLDFYDTSYVKLLGLILLLTTSSAHKIQSIQLHRDSKDGETEVKPINANTRIKYTDKPHEITNNEEFIPTNEWQSIKKGQAVPSGLHYRINFQTGEKEAKLLEPEESAPKEETIHKEDSKEYNHHGGLKSLMEDAAKELKDGELKYWKEGDREGMADLSKKEFSRSELKDALKKFKAAKVDEKPADVKNRFKSMDEIMDEFAKMNMGMKTDLEIVTGLVKRYKVKDILADERVRILTDLEYYLHQIDNAVYFADSAALDILVLDLNSTDAAVRSSAALALGAAAQSNPKVQVRAIHQKALPLLLRLLSVEPTLPVRNRALYAISSLIRHFPFAQLKFVESGGVTGLSALLKQKAPEVLQVRALTLVTDLIEERRKNLQDLKGKEDSAAKQKYTQYSQVDLKKAVVDQDWCSYIPKLLHLTDHDQREHVINAMLSLADRCSTRFRLATEDLQRLNTAYKKLAAEEDDITDDYFQTLSEKLERLLVRLDSNAVKEEL